MPKEETVNIIHNLTSLMDLLGTSMTQFSDIKEAIGKNEIPDIYIEASEKLGQAFLLFREARDILQGAKDMKFSSVNEALQHLSDITGKKIKIAGDKPVSLTVFGQKIIDQLYEEMESEEPGEMTLKDQAPVGLMAIDQPLIQEAWEKSREKHGIK
jgi:hypothetical protein